MAAQWYPAQGVPHPTGGYDDVLVEVDDHDPNGGGVHEEATSYTRGGVLHRLDGPAHEVHHDGEIFIEEWCIEGRHHRTDGPALIRYDRGTAVWQEWYVEGKNHRLDGPAKVGAPYLAAPERAEFYIAGIPLTGEGHALVTGALADGAPLEWALAYAEGLAS